MKKKNNAVLDWLLKANWNYLLLGTIIIVVVAVMSCTTRNYFSIANLNVMINNFIMEAIMALGVTMVIISGGTDISISGILPFTAIMTVYMMKWGMPIAVALALGVVIGGVIGLINNELRRVLHIHPMIVTMSVQLILKGLNMAITEGSVIADVPEQFMKLTFFKPLGIAIPIWIYVILAVFFVLFSKRNELFIKVFFVGGNEEGARLSGVKTEGVLRFVYVVSGLLAGLAGVLSAITYSGASYSYGQNSEMRAITAIAIGGTCMTHGGEGSIVGTIIGSLFLAVIYNAFLQSGISTYFQDVFTGSMLIIAVLFGQVLGVLKKKALDKNEKAQALK